MTSPPSSSIGKRVPCSLPASDAYWTGTSFNENVLPKRPSRGDEGTIPVPTPSFLEYLKKGPPTTRQRLGETCRDSWAFTLCFSVEMALQLSYEKLGVRFTNRYLSVDYLLSCYEQGPAEMCGCHGADLPTAFKLVSEQGMVSFSQFPYLSSDVLNLTLGVGMDVVYFCDKKDHLGTCSPCKASLDDYSESVLAASPDIGAFRFIVPCLPCSQPVSPKYFPKQPFVVEGNNLAERIVAVKRELVRTGPLSFALAVDADVLTSLLSGGSPPRVTQTHEGLFYRPHRVVKDASFYAALLLGYSETPEKQPVWICPLQVSGGGFGYDLLTENGTVEGLFNIDMNDEVAGTLSRVISFEEVQIITGDDARPRPLGRQDPFLIDLASEMATSKQAVMSNTMTSLKEVKKARTSLGPLFWTSLVFVALLALVFIWIVSSRSHDAM